MQKEGFPGVSGCIGHTNMLTLIIREAKENKRDLAVIWLDLSTAYGTVPHQLIDITLSSYHTPEKWRELPSHYLGKPKVPVHSGRVHTSPQPLEVGIVTECSISVILFTAAKNLLVKAAKNSSRGPTMSSGIQQPSTRMDDMTVTAKSAVEGRWMFEDLEHLFFWAQMTFKLSKWHSLVLKKGNVQDNIRFKIGGKMMYTNNSRTASEEPWQIV